MLSTMADIIVLTEIETIIIIKKHNRNFVKTFRLKILEQSSIRFLFPEFMLYLQFMAKFYINT